MTLSHTPCHLTVVPAASAAPIMPPISACEDEEGRPKYQVARFQVIAPTSSEKTTTRPAVFPCGIVIRPLVIALATPPPSRSPIHAPARFITAAISSAA